MALSKSPNATKLDPRQSTTESDKIGDEVNVVAAKNPVSRSKLDDNG